MPHNSVYLQFFVFIDLFVLRLINFYPVDIHVYLLSVFQCSDGIDVCDAGKTSTYSQIEQDVEVMVKIFITSADFADVESVKLGSVYAYSQTVLIPFQQVGMIFPILQTL